MMPDPCIDYIAARSAELLSTAVRLVPTGLEQAVRVRDAHVDQALTFRRAHLLLRLPPWQPGCGSRSPQINFVEQTPSS